MKMENKILIAPGIMLSLTLIVMWVAFYASYWSDCNEGVPYSPVLEDISALNSALEIHCVQSGLNSAQRAKVSAADLVENNLLQWVPTDTSYMYQNAGGIFTAIPIPEHFHPPASGPAGE